MPKKKLEPLTEQMHYVLLVLNKELCGVEIMDEVSKITNKRIQLGPGTLYAILSQFEEEKIIIQTKIEGRKRSYIITEVGKKLLMNEYQRLQDIVKQTEDYWRELYETKD